MKALSLILTILLILPIGYSIISAYESYTMQSVFMHEHGIGEFEWHIFAPIAENLVYLGVAVVLNAKEKYVANSFICGTLLGTFFLSLLFFYGVHIFFLFSNTNK
jgi:hypothetical protein